MRDLKLGDTGDDVREVQGFLAGIGLKCTVDGVFGPETDHAVREFQANQSADNPALYTGVLVADGIVGPKTLLSITQAYDMGHS
jgi:peptidoglycan hydrolase-like protein with peptidoglycan-binding domain